MNISRSVGVLYGCVVALSGCGATVAGGARDSGVGDTAVIDTAVPDVSTTVVDPPDVAPVADAPAVDAPPPWPLPGRAIDSADILFEIDNSNSMRDNQSLLTRQFDALIARLLSPPVDPTTMRPRYPPLRSLHVGVISSDLGTPGSVVPSCANSDLGDDGLLNPIRRGLSIRTHQPWVTAPAGVRPARCTMDPNQYPTWLEFDAASAIDPNAATVFRDDLVCNAYLSTGGCGIEQQLEAAFRALVIHNAREAPGNMAPNAGFVRDDAVLAIVVLSDEEDGSTRDCRYAESGQRCTDATSVFDTTSNEWSSTDLNLRFYLYRQGTAQDPTWPIDRYIDPRNPRRGFTSLKPDHPERVVFAAITGVPLAIPPRAGDPTAVDWDALLNVQTMTPEGPVSMRPANMDPSCSTRVVPACRREGSAYDPAHPPCDPTQQYFAWPSRRIVQVARGFDEAYQNGFVSSICRSSYEEPVQQIAERIQRRLAGRCLPREVPTTPAVCGLAGATTGCISQDAARATPLTVPCVVREVLSAAVNVAEWCVAAHGRRRAGVVGGRNVCLVDPVPAPYRGVPASGAHGFYYDTAVDPTEPTCGQRISFTAGDALAVGSTATLECTR